MSSMDDEILVAIKANTEQMQQGVAQATATLNGMQAKVAEEAAAFNAAVNAKIDAMVRLNAAFQGNLATTQGIAEAELALDQAMGAGAITANEYAGYIARLDAAEGGAAVSADAATAAIERQTAAMAINGGVARELGVMIGELARGNYTRLEGSTITLANRTGALGTALGYLLSPVGLASAAIAGLGYEVYEAGNNFRDLERVVAATGGALGLSAGQIDVMADHVADMTHDLDDARAVLEALAMSGRVSGADLQTFGTAAAGMAALTGEKAQTAANHLLRMFDDPLKVAPQLNDQLHFLTVAQYQQMEALAATGDKAGAARIAIDALAAAAAPRLQEIHDKAWWLSRDADAFAASWHHATQEIYVGTGYGDVAEKLQIAQRDLAGVQEQLRGVGLSDQDRSNLTKLAETYSEEVKKLTSELKKESDARKGVADATRDQTKAVDDLAARHGGGDKKDDQTATRTDRDAFRQMQLDHDLSIQDEKRYWQAKRAAAKEGTEEYRQAVEQLLAIKHREEQAEQEAARKGVQAQRERRAAILNELEIERNDTAQASAERIAADSRIVTRAAQLYGQDSAAFKRALAERLADIKAYVDAYNREQQRELNNTLDIYERENENAVKAIQGVYRERIQAAQQQLSLGEITASQEADILRGLADQEYQIELGILQHYRELMAERPRVVAAINGQIEQLEQQHQQRLQQINAQAVQRETQLWEGRLRPITQAFDQSIAGMIQGTQTLQQGISRMLQSILLSYIRTGLDTLAHHVAVEMAKTSATTAGAASRTTIEMTAAAATKATDAKTGQSQISTAAATGAAKAYQAMVGIPYVGPIIAPIAAAVAFAGIEAFGSGISSAAGGWDRVPYDDAPTLLHRNEMVLPASLADGVRRMAAQPKTSTAQGGGIVVHNHIQAIDAKNLRDHLLRNPGALAAGLSQMGRTGWKP